MNYDIKVTWKSYSGFLNSKTHQIYFLGRVYTDITDAIANEHQIEHDYKTIQIMQDTKFKK